jgi:hypothetical protein
MSNWLQQEQGWLQAGEFFQRQIDEARRFDEWERRKERAAETDEDPVED